MKGQILQYKQTCSAFSVPLALQLQKSLYTLNTSALALNIYFFACMKENIWASACYNPNS